MTVGGKPRRAGVHQVYDFRIRAQRRGFKEADLIFGTFAAIHLDDLGTDELDQFEAILDVPDRDVVAWLQGALPLPAEFTTPVFEKLKALCARTNPEWSS